MRAAPLFVALLAACSGGGRTEILVEVHSDLLVPEELDRVAITARAPDDRVQPATAELGPGQVPLPRVLGMVHTDGPLGPYHLTVRGERRGATVVTREASVTFVQGRTLVLRVDLLRQCIDATCEAGQTCAVGGCRSIEVGPGELTEWDGRPPPRDAAAFDACVPERCNGVDDDCDGETDEGFDLTSDGANCGACGVSCARPNTTASCVDSECVIDACEAPYDDCDGDPGTGCETDTSSSFQHCGACGAPCSPPDRVCNAGVCARG